MDELSPNTSWTKQLGVINPYRNDGDFNSRILLVYTFLGLNMEAGAIYTLCTALGEFFYHTNVKTPNG
jgi:hypothetical protein